MAYKPLPITHIDARWWDHNMVRYHLTIGRIKGAVMERINVPEEDERRYECYIPHGSRSVSHACSHIEAVKAWKAQQTGDFISTSFFDPEKGRHGSALPDER